MPFTLTGDSLTDGTTFVPLDPENADYRQYLADTGQTHDEMLAAATEARAVIVADAGKERDRQAVLARSGRKKLVALGLTRPELRALGLIDPDPDA